MKRLKEGEVSGKLLKVKRMASSSSSVFVNEDSELLLSGEEDRKRNECLRFPALKMVWDVAIARKCGFAIVGEKELAFDGGARGDFTPVMAPSPLPIINERKKDKQQIHRSFFEERVKQKTLERENQAPLLNAPIVKLQREMALPKMDHK